MARGRKPGAQRWDDDDWGSFPPASRPIPTERGIKAKSERGAFGGSWWAKRWSAVLESFGWGNRLQRGRSYARQGQVLTLDLSVGQVQSKVQGSRPTPYKVVITIPPLTNGQWERVADALA